MVSFTYHLELSTSWSSGDKYVEDSEAAAAVPRFQVGEGRFIPPFLSLSLGLSIDFVLMVFSLE